VSIDRHQLIHASFDAFNRRDAQSLIDVCDPAVELFPFRAQLEGEPYCGHDGIERFLAHLADDWEEFRVEPDTIEDAGDRVATTGRIHARSRRSGVEFDSIAGFVTELRGDKIARMKSFSDPAEARRSAGLAD
jgi:ketosteroid isomerase-like protein